MRTLGVMGAKRAHMVADNLITNRIDFAFEVAEFGEFKFTVNEQKVADLDFLIDHANAHIPDHAKD